MKLKLGHSFSQFTNRFKIRIFGESDLSRTSTFFDIHKKILGFLNVALAGLLNFSEFMRKVENLVLLIYKFQFHVFLSSLKSRENLILEVPLISYWIHLTT